MNYEQFFSDVAKWIVVSERVEKQLGLNSAKFWQWVSDTLARLCGKYDNHPLAKNQAVMLWQWLLEKKNK